MEGRKEREKKAYRHGSMKNTERFPKRAPKVQDSGGSGGRLPRKGFAFLISIFNFLSHSDKIWAKFSNLLKIYLL